MKAHIIPLNPCKPRAASCAQSSETLPRSMTSTWLRNSLCVNQFFHGNFTQLHSEEGRSNLCITHIHMQTQPFHSVSHCLTLPVHVRTESMCSGHTVEMLYEVCEMGCYHHLTDPYELILSIVGAYTSLSRLHTFQCHYLAKFMFIQIIFSNLA